MAGEVRVVTQTTDADVAAFHSDDAERQDLRSLMEGTQVQQGGQHDMLARGMTSDRGEFNQPPDFTDVHPLMPAEQPFVQPQGQPKPVSQPAGQPGEQDFRQLYGRSENEKGELRRALKEQLDSYNALAQQVTQMQSLLAQPPQYNGNGYNSNAYFQPAPYPTYDQPVGHQYSQVPARIGHGQPPQEYRGPSRFVAKPDGEMMYAEDVEATFNSTVAPAMFNTYQVAEQARRDTQELRAMLLDQAKASRGITPQVEAQAIIERPWIRNLQHQPQAYLAALTDYTTARNSAQVLAKTGQPHQAMPQAVMPATAQAAGRRITYIEGAPGQATVDPGAQPNQFAQDMQSAMQEHHPSKRADLMRKVFAKHGMTQTNDWRDPSVIS